MRDHALMTSGAVEILYNGVCPVCRAGIDTSFLSCPVCTTKLKQACRHCRQPLEPLWQICPYCETPVEQPTIAGNL